MAGSMVGVDIGGGTLKLAVRHGGDATLLSARMPENMVSNARVVAPETMSEFLKHVKRENHIRVSDCTLVLSSAFTHFRKVEIPAMTIDELKVNLPYEFRDYVTEDPANYFYDYVVKGTEYDEAGKPVAFSLYAAAVLKETVDSYSDILRRAGFRLKVALPRTMVYMNMLSEHIRRNPTAVQQEFCLVDVGNEHTSVDFFKGDEYVASKVIDYGCRNIDEVISDVKDVDLYIAGTYRASDYESVLEMPELRQGYDSLAVEILKVINFYNFSTPDNQLADLYFTGGGADIQGLLDTVDGQTDLQPHRIAELLPPAEGPVTLCALAYAATLGQQRGAR